ncbi:MAG: multidrug efflux RND transporter permease subunit [Megasphaera sp.]|jgi:hydrophobe/amphiphile efflux-1 (HAE1) family protein|uniref:efflux RND transporter permease subunit n=1 Tax=Megasphaera sueciensis TaxID=349094 RepID=UPI003CFF2423|nr:multidrug efflux RND transporter permease subunit [Megasphaera sp.]MCI1822548.1 multidrug efflux RND transporter permease subunit [Megasphaera sp.]
MAKFFIERPVFAIVLSVIIVLLGIVSILNLSIAQYPKITPPTVSISTSYQGANAEVVNDSVAQVIEQEVNGVDGMDNMTGTVADDGSYKLRIQFEAGKDPNVAAVQVQDRVSSANPSLPTTVQEKGIASRNSSEDMAFVFQLYSPNHTYDAKFLKNYGSLYLVDGLKRIDGIGDVNAFGADYSIRVWLQPDKMAKLGVSTSDVVLAIKKQNLEAPIGALGTRPTDDKQALQFTTRIKGRLSDAAQFGKLIVLAKADGSIVYLKDIAKIEMGSENYTNITEQNGNESAGFAILLNSKANTLQSINEVKKYLENAKKDFPPDMDYIVSVDNTKFIRESMLEVSKTFVEALLLVVLIVFLFLQNWRATLIPLLAIPVSLIGTFAAFIILRFNINTLTLFALVLSIGLVVDDAIVVIEAVEHHMRYDCLNPHDATCLAMNEVSGPIVAIACVLASVFLPVAFFQGMTGILYRQFALTIVISMALSALVALSLTPALCAKLLRPYQPISEESVFGRFFKKFNGKLTAYIEKYGVCLRQSMLKTKLSICFLVFLVIFSGVLYKLVPTTFIPEEDQGRYIVAINLPEASGLGRTKEAVEKVSKMIQQQPGVAQVMSLTGMDLLGGGNKSSAGAVFVSLHPWEERKNSDLSVQSEIGKTMMSGKHLQEGTLLALNPPALPGLGAVGGFSLMLEDRAGGTLNNLDAVSQQFIAAAQKRPEIGRISSNFKASTPGYEYNIDRDKAKVLGVSISDIFSTLQVFLGGNEVNDFTLFGRNYKVAVQADGMFRGDVSALQYLHVKNASGDMVPLNTLITPKKVYAPSVISRFNGVKAARINGSQAPGYSSGQAMKALEEVAAQTLPEGYTYEWAGQSREEQKSSSKAPILFGLAFLFAFLCLAALYESWSVPFAVLLAIPAGIFGAFFFQYLRGLEDSIYMQIGLIMLVGLAAKNAILIVEFAKIRVDQGMVASQAAVEAAQLRVRPIIMTSLTFIIGCLPLMFASGAGAGARTSMGTAVVGGMLAATAIGIFLIPTLFVAIEKKTGKFHFWHKL